MLGPVWSGIKPKVHGHSVLLSHLSKANYNQNYNYNSNTNIIRQSMIKMRENVGNNNDNNSNNNIDSSNSSSSNNNDNLIISPPRSPFLSFDINSLLYTTNYSSKFPINKLSKRLKISQNLSEFEKENIEYFIISQCVYSAQNQSLSFLELIEKVKSANFHNDIINTVNSYLIEDNYRVKECVRKMQELGYFEVTILNNNNNSTQTLNSTGKN